MEKSNYQVEFLPGQDIRGRHRLAFVAKRTYSIDTDRAKTKIAEEQAPVALNDNFSDPENPTKAYVIEEQELHAYKIKQDVVMKATAHAPGGVATETFDVTMTVGHLKKTLRVIGPRYCIYQPPQKIDKKNPLDDILTDPVFSEPEPIDKLPLTWEHAYGGHAYYIPRIPLAYQDAREHAEKVAEKREAKKKAKEEEAAKAAAEEDKKKADQAAIDKAFGEGGDEPEPQPEPEPEPEVEEPVEKDGTKVLSEEDLAALEDLVDDAPKDLAPNLDEVQKDEKGTRIFSYAEKGEAYEVEDRDWEADYKKKEEVQEEVEEEEEELPYDKFPCPTNGSGVGFCISNAPESVDGLPLPMIEDPRRPLIPETFIQDFAMMDAIPEPAGFWWVAKSWFPRAHLGGIPPYMVDEIQDNLDDYAMENYDVEDEDDRIVLDTLLDRELPVLKPLFFNAAPADQQITGLRGDEEVRITNVSPEGMYFFKLPGDHPLVLLDRGNGYEPIPTDLDTIIIDVDGNELRLIWRGSIPYGGPEELSEYTVFDIDVEDWKARDYEDEMRRKDATSKKEEGGTKVIDLEEIEKIEEEKAALKAQRAEEAAAAAALAAAKVQTDEGGTKIFDAADDVRITDDEWVEDAKDAKLDEEDAMGLAKKLSEKEARKAKKEALKKRIAEIKAAEEAAQKK